MYTVSTIWRVLVGCLILTLLLAQVGCDVSARLRKPISDFEEATAVVTAQARLAYVELNRAERLLAIKTARRLKKRLDPRQLRGEADLLSGDDLTARLDALDHLDQFAKLLVDIVNSDITEKVTTSANGLKTALDGLAARIDKLRDDQGTETSASSTGTSSEPVAEKPNNRRFKAAFGVVTTVASEVLSFVAKKKRDDALKRAIRDGDAPVNNLVEAIKSDLHIAFLVRQRNLDSEIQTVYQAYNTEIELKTPNQNQLDELEKAILANLEAEDAFYATDPTEALNRMQEAHTKMVRFANQQASETELLGAVQSYVEAATRLGAAVVKLKAKNSENS